MNVIDWLKDAQPVVIALIGLIQAIKGADFWKKKKAEKKATKAAKTGKAPHMPL